MVVKMLSSLILLTAVQLAYSYNGMINHFSGDVTVVTGDQSAKAKIGAKVGSGDSVKTGKDSLAMLLMSDGAVIKINEKSEHQVPKEAEKELTLKAGSIFSKIPKQAQEQQFRIRTPSAVIGVRGTQFFTSFGQDDKTKADVWMCVNEGSVEVTSTANQKKVLVHEGEGVLVPDGKDVTPPKKYEWTKGLNWKMDPKDGDLVNRSTINYEKKILREEYD